MSYFFNIHSLVTESSFVSPLMQDLSSHLSSNLKYPYVKAGYDPNSDSSIILMLSLSNASQWKGNDFYKSPYCVFVIEPGSVSQYNKSAGFPSFKKSFFNNNDECCSIIDSYMSSVGDNVVRTVSETILNLPKATIPRDVQVRMNKLSDILANKTDTFKFNHKVNILSDIIYDLKLNKAEMGKLLQKLKTTFSAMKEEYIKEASSTLFYAFWNKKRYKIEAEDLWDAKQKAIKILKVPKSKVGMLAVVSAKEHDSGGYKFEHRLNEIDKPIKSEGSKKFYVFWKGTRYTVSADDYKEAKQKAITALGVTRSDVGMLAVVSVDEHDSGDFQFDEVISTIKHPLIQQFNNYHDINDAIELAKSSKNFKDFMHKLYDHPVMGPAYTKRNGFIPFIQVVFKHATQK